MSRKIIEIYLVLFIAACSLDKAAAHNKSVHQQLTEEAMDIAGDAWGADWLPEEILTESASFSSSSS